ncbi:splicing regulator SDE2 [Rhinophrynus dorsalis]
MAVAEVWVRDVISGKVSVAELPYGATVRDLLLRLESGLPLHDIYVKCNGHLAGTEEKLQNGLVYSLEPRLCGGKGGFGSMLRALGAQIEKTTNREACRDLSGRRLRDVNHEKAMAEWTKKQADREAEKEQRRLERLQRKLAEPKHYFTDPEYHQQCSDMSERLEESVIKGLQASSSTVVSPGSSDSLKRKKEPESSKVESGKKKCFWTGVEDLESDTGSGSDSEESPCTSSSSSSCKQLLRPQNDCDESEPLQTTRAISEDPPEQAGAQSSVPSTSQMEQNDVDSEQKIEVAENKMAENTRQEKLEVQPEPQQETANSGSSPFDLLAFETAAELEALGLDKLKLELMALGLKCGGTLQERAARLFSVRGLSRDQIDPSLFAKPAKGKKK